jgi:Ni/Fe-hydrogenase subunit HybB-like protein
MTNENHRTRILPRRQEPRIQDALFLGLTPAQYLRSLITPFNCIAAVIMLPGLFFLVLRFIYGLAAVTSASNEQPWSLLLAWGLFAGVPLSSTGFLMTTAEHIFGAREYRPVVRNAILLGFLGYLFAVIFLLIDLGRPWRIYYPMTWAFGPASVMFLIAWHVSLYLSCQALELAPSAFEWLKLGRLRNWALSITLGLTIGGVVLSTLHQSALGAMFLLEPGKLHPLWYTPYIPWLFFLSSIASGLSFVIVVSFLTKRLCKEQADAGYLDNVDAISFGLGKGSAIALFAYFGLKLVALAHGDNWDLLKTSWGLWYLFELIGFVAIPMLLFIIAERRHSLRLVRFSALMTVLGVILNRFNVSLLTFSWKLHDRELFSWKELSIILAMATIEILIYRWIVRRMPVLRTISETTIESV